MEIRASTPSEHRASYTVFSGAVRSGSSQVGRIGDRLARVGPRRADEDALAVARPLQHLVVDADDSRGPRPAAGPALYSTRCE